MVNSRAAKAKLISSSSFTCSVYKMRIRQCLRKRAALKTVTLPLFENVGLMGPFPKIATPLRSFKTIVPVPKAAPKVKLSNPVLSSNFSLVFAEIVVFF
jgi:hypothetical protein